MGVKHISVSLSSSHMVLIASFVGGEDDGVSIFVVKNDLMMMMMAECNAVHVHLGVKLRTWWHHLLAVMMTSLNTLAPFRIL